MQRGRDSGADADDDDDDADADEIIAIFNSSLSLLLATITVHKPPINTSRGRKYMISRMMMK